MMRKAADQQALRLGASEFRRRYANPNYPWSNKISYGLGAHLALFAIRNRIRPSTISYLGALVSVLSSAMVVALFPLDRVIAAAVAFVGWQLAYALDCTDGQVARATGTVTPEGGILDVTNDWVSHIAVLAAMIWVSGSDWLGPWTGIGIVAVTGTSMYGMAYSKWSASISRKVSLKGRHPFIDLTRYARDYGFQLAVLAVAITLGSQAALIALLAFSSLDALFIAHKLVVLGRAPDRPDQLSDRGPGRG